ncbi:EamA family transporter [Thalassomonas actiniarum]|uniref:EamA family transporter n=1 Tax=Thalassomonas actiniarum TaxID=485447 RepID=A0AAE9YPF9_9GAMM|nr:EamA family transporter [Thalassomonas actiniarum]WDD98810.1 EamA family transporter [Thalassomonas actiniarum]
MTLSISNSSQALVANICAFFLWSAATLIFNALSGIDNLQVLALRILFAMLFCTGLLAFIPQVRRSLVQLKGLEWRLLLLSSILIASNWYLVIFAISLNQLSSASLGYFLAPILSVALLKWRQKEKVSAVEFIAICLCLLGAVVVIQARYLHSLPWIGITIAATFAWYSVLKKTRPIAPLVTLTVETGFAAIPALLFIVLGLLGLGDSGLGISGHSYDFTAGQWGLMLLLGAVTTLPILLYIGSVVFLSATTIGLLQYLNPTLMLLVAIGIFGEKVSDSVLGGFLILWSGILVYAICSVYGVVNTITARRS